MENKEYYFDSVSSTKPNLEVIELHDRLLKKYYANSDALYESGIAIYHLMEKARKKIAVLLGIKNDEVIFTSGASESNNLAIKGLLFANLDSSKHIILSPYEHSSINVQAKQLSRLFGVKIDYLSLNSDGSVDFDSLKQKLKKDTLLVSVMAVNNEIGAINDIDKIGEYVKKNSNAYFHSDVTQALTKLELSFKNVDLASFSAHKIHGLKGSGVLIKKSYVKLESLISGGQQEFGYRGGTSDYAKNICLAKALILAFKNKEETNLRVSRLMHYLETNLKKLKYVTIVSPKKHINSLILIKTPLTSEVMLNALNEKKIYISSKSTCGTRLNEISETAKAFNYDDKYVVRISLDNSHSEKDIDYLCECIKEVIELWKK